MVATFTYQHSIGKSRADREAIKKALNGYLFAEYGFGIADEARISDNWPFELRPLGTIQMPAGDVYVFEFEDEVGTCFAISGYSTTCYSTDGMTFDELCLQMIGSNWIARQRPVDLNTVCIGDDTIPPTRQREAAIEALAANVFPTDSEPHICEGLFLRSTATYLALVQHSASEETVIVGSTMEPWSVHVSARSAWRKLAFGVGQMIIEGKLKEM